MGQFYFSQVWNFQDFKSGFLKQSASLDHLFVYNSTPSLPPATERKTKQKSLSLNISLAFSNTLWPHVNPVMTSAYVGSWPTVGKHWPRSKMLVRLLLRDDLTAVHFCGCGELLARMLWPVNHKMLCFVHIREFIPWSLRRNKDHTAQKWGFCLSSWLATTTGDLKPFSSLFHFLKWGRFFNMTVILHWLDITPQQIENSMSEEDPNEKRT